MAEEIISSLSESNYSNRNAFNFSGATQAKATLFTPSKNAKITKAKFYMARTNTYSGYVYAKLYSVSGGEPSSVLATSDAVDVSTIGSSNALISFIFSSSEQYEMINGTNYAIAVWLNFGQLAKLYAGYGSSGSYSDKSFVLNNGSWFDYSSTVKYIFYVYGEPSASKFIPQIINS